MKKGIVLGVMLAFALVAARAQDKPADSPKDMKAPATVTLKGYIVDQSCGKGMSKKPNAMQKAASHTQDCALEDACAAAGYGLFSDGKWYVFDQNGSKQVKSSLEKDKREKGLAYEVTGTLDGNTITLASLKPTTLATAVPSKSEKESEKK